MDHTTVTAAPMLKPFRVLSLDGGGMRGIYTGAFLDRLVAQFARSRGERRSISAKGFDLITGTSTGAIVGCAVAVGTAVGEVVELYREHGRKISRIGSQASGARSTAPPQGNRVVRQGNAALRDALHEVLGNKTMIDVFERRGISLSIPAVLMKTHRAWVFKKTPKSGVRDDLYPLVDVCLASSAAPIYRSLAAIDDPSGKHGLKQVFADGGLWANNPIMVGLVDALTVAAPGSAHRDLSLGTCSRPEGEHVTEEGAHRSMLDWKLGADVAPLSISAQEFAFDNMARLLSNVLTDIGGRSKPSGSRTRPCPPDDAVPRAGRCQAGGDGSADPAGELGRRPRQERLRRPAQRGRPDGPPLMMDLPPMPATGIAWEDQP